jgi:Ca2+-binding EF-hand superfamily protein
VDDGHVRTNIHRFIRTTLTELHELLDGNEITNFDPVLEAFKCFDPHSTGYADISTMRAIFARLGMDLSDEDVKVLVATADSDKDNAVSLLDFRDMLRRASLKRDEEAAAATREAAERHY